VRYLLDDLRGRDHFTLGVETVELRGLLLPLAIAWRLVDLDGTGLVCREMIDWTSEFPAAEVERGLAALPPRRPTLGDLRRGGLRPADVLGSALALLRPPSGRDLVCVVHDPWPGLRAVRDAIPIWLGQPAPDISVVSTGLMHLAWRGGPRPWAPCQEFVVDADAQPRPVPDLARCLADLRLEPVFTPEAPAYVPVATHLLFRELLHRHDEFDP
jgi:hypothetical protein